MESPRDKRDTNSEHASAGAAREDRASEFSGSFPSAWFADSFLFMDPS